MGVYTICQNLNLGQYYIYISYFFEYYMAAWRCLGVTTLFTTIFDWGLSQTVSLSVFCQFAKTLLHQSSLPRHINIDLIALHEKIRD